MNLKSKIIVGILGVVLVGSGVSVYFIKTKKEEPKENVIMVNECPTGYVDKENKCVKEEDFVYICPKELTLEDNKCIKTIVKNATEIGKCPTGTVDIKLTEYCGKNPKSAAHRNNTCPAGTLYEKIQPGGYLYCYMSKRDYNPPYDTCGGGDKSHYFDTSSSICYYNGSPAGVTWNCNHLPGTHLYEKQCYDTVKKEINYTCPKGSTQDNNKCYTYEKTDATKTCKENFVLKDDKCVHEIPIEAN